MKSTRSSSSKKPSQAKGNQYTSSTSSLCCTTVFQSSSQYLGSLYHLLCQSRIVREFMAIQGHTCSHACEKWSLNSQTVSCISMRLLQARATSPPSQWVLLHLQLKKCHQVTGHKQGASHALTSGSWASACSSTARHCTTRASTPIPPAPIPSTWN